MPKDLTDKLTEVAMQLLSVVEDAKEDLGILTTYYGDQQLIGATPIVCVEPGPLTQTLAGAPSYRVQNSFTMFLFIYHGTLQDAQVTKLACDQLAEAVRDRINHDPQLDGLVLQGNVTSVEPGYAVRGTSLLRSTRITWTGVSKTRIVTGG